MHLSRQWNCRLLRCSRSIACRRCSNYIFIIDLTPGLKGLGKDDFKTRWESFKFCASYIRDFTVVRGCQWDCLTDKLWSVFNTLRPKWNGRHFADDIFKCIFLNENVWISFKISMKFVPKGPINNIPALVQIMAWRRTGDKPLSEPMIVSFTDAYMRHSASMS